MKTTLNDPTIYAKRMDRQQASAEPTRGALAKTQPQVGRKMISIKETQNNKRIGQKTVGANNTADLPFNMDSKTSEKPSPSKKVMKKTRNTHDQVQSGSESPRYPVTLAVGQLVPTISSQTH